MPHKHKRKHGEDDPSTFDLHPSSRAKTLPVHKKADSIFTSDIEKKQKYEARRQKKEHKKDQQKQNKSSEYKDDDTPKAFKRMMMFQEGKRVRSGLDDGASTKKKRKLKAETESNSKPTSTPTAAKEQSTITPTTTTSPPDAQQSSSSTTPALKILPTESLSTFSQRVDQSLPLSSIPKHKTKELSVPGLGQTSKLKTPLTKHNKRLARMQKDWRSTDLRHKQKQEDLDDERADQKEEDTLLWLGAGIDPSNPMASSSRKKKRKGGVLAPDDVDPWKILEKKRRDEGEVKQRNLQDVVTAPPVLKPLKNIFKVKDERGYNGSGQSNTSRAVMT